MHRTYYNEYGEYRSHAAYGLCGSFCVFACCLLCCAIPGMVTLITLNQVLKEWPTAEAVVVGKIDCVLVQPSCYTLPCNGTQIDETSTPTNETWAQTNGTLVPRNETVPPSNETLVPNNETLAPCNHSEEVCTIKVTLVDEYRIVYNFTTSEGEEVSVQTEQCYGNVPRVGSTDTIYYNPEDPTEIHEEDSIYLELSIAKTATIIGWSIVAIFFCFGMYVCIKNKKQKYDDDNFVLDPTKPVMPIAGPQNPIMPISTTAMAGNTPKDSNINNDNIINNVVVPVVVDAVVLDP